MCDAEEPALPTVAEFFESIAKHDMNEAADFLAPPGLSVCVVVDAVRGTFKGLGLKAGVGFVMYFDGTFAVRITPVTPAPL